ncbi:hypothetical protein GQ42DRAFT_91860 [Ramicandelaber brevisporus]|nr:hypothetical protein GQ42DRAFT_91860 [Ramicandelaber brevisporus]
MLKTTFPDYIPLPQPQQLESWNLTGHGGIDAQLTSAYRTVYTHLAGALQPTCIICPDRGRCDGGVMKGCQVGYTLKQYHPSDAAAAAVTLTSDSPKSLLSPLVDLFDHLPWHPVLHIVYPQPSVCVPDPSKLTLAKQVQHDVQALLSIRAGEAICNGTFDSITDEYELERAHLMYGGMKVLKLYDHFLVNYTTKSIENGRPKIKSKDFTDVWVLANILAPEHQRELGLDHKELQFVNPTNGKGYIVDYIRSTRPVYTMKCKYITIPGRTITRFFGAVADEVANISQIIVNNSHLVAYIAGAIGLWFIASTIYQARVQFDADVEAVIEQVKIRLIEQECLHFADSLANPYPYMTVEEMRYDIMTGTTSKLGAKSTSTGNGDIMTPMRPGTLRDASPASPGGYSHSDSSRRVTFSDKLWRRVEELVEISPHIRVKKVIGKNGKVQRVWQFIGGSRGYTTPADKLKSLRSLSSMGNLDHRSVPLRRDHGIGSPFSPH